LTSDDHIDKTQWIKGPIVTPERAAKGKMMIAIICPECKGDRETCKTCKECHTRGNILVENNGSFPMEEVLYVQFLERNLMNWLWERDILDDQNLHDGQTYERWQMIYRAKRGRGVNSKSLHGVTDSEAGCAEYGFSLILQRLNPGYQKAINTTFSHANDYGRWVIWDHRYRYLTAFQSLTYIMPQIHADVKKSLDESKKKAQDAFIDGDINAPGVSPR
jgi:hypothetical protein